MVKQEECKACAPTAFPTCEVCGRDLVRNGLTLIEMIEDMPNIHICRGEKGKGSIWWAYIEPWGVIEDGKGRSPNAAVRALYEKWKAQ